LAINYGNITEYLIRLFEINLLYYIMIWKILLGLYIIGVIYLVYEMYNAPVMPDDYDLSDEEKNIMKDIKKQDDEFEDDYENQPFGD